MSERFTWRDEASPIIAEVIARVGLSDMKAFRRTLRDAYPWGELALNEQTPTLIRGCSVSVLRQGS